MFNPFKRVFYPCDSQVSEGSTDLGRDHEMETARLFCHAYEGNTPPVTILATGDTGMFTDGALNSIQHLVEANERGLRMPLVYLVSMNNSAISTRFDKGRTYGLEEQDVCLMKLENRFAQYSSLIDPGFVNRTQDMREGIIEIRKAVDQVLETGRPTYVISSFPFRPGGHASDANPAPEGVILDQFKKTLDIYTHQIANAAPKDMSGPELAAYMESFLEQVETEVEKAIRGTHYMTKDEAREISQPGITTSLSMEQDPGTILEVNKDYLTGENVTAFAGMGSDIYGKTINSVFDVADASGRSARYVHQENHYAGTNDTRGGVYGELNAVEAKHTTKFVSIFPNEAQVMQAGAGFRSVLPDNNLVIVKGPHTIFNEHARDIMKYGSMMNLDRGFPGNVIYLFDGGSIANKEVMKPDDTGFPGRDMWLARVGEHHNTIEYSSYAADANTVMCMPMDQNLLAASMNEMIRLYDMGRFVTCVAPTSSFGLLHGQFESSKGAGATFGVNDFMRVNFNGGNAPANGRKLIVMGYGPDSKMVAKTLNSTGLNCEFLVLNYNRCPNALESYMKSLIDQDVDVMVVEQNCDAALLGPVITELKQKINYPRNWYWRDCTVSKTYIPYGFGENLLQESDVIQGLKGKSSSFVSLAHPP